MITDGGIQSGSAEFSVMTLVQGFFVACYNILLYAGKLIWPAKLSVLYTGATGWPLPAEYLAAPAVLGLIVVGVIGLRKRFRLKVCNVRDAFLRRDGAYRSSQFDPGRVSHNRPIGFVYIPAIGMFLLAGLGRMPFTGGSRVDLNGWACVGSCARRGGGQLCLWGQARATAWRDSVSLWSAESSGR